MRPLTLLRAKPVIPVLNRPLLHWTLELLARHGVREVVINLHHLPDSIRDAVGAGRRFGLRVRYSHERRILGTSGGPRKARRLLGDEPILIVNGDMIFDFDLGALVERHRSSGARATLALKRNPDPRRYGPIVTGRGGWIRSVPGFERRSSGVVSLFTGVQVVDPGLLERLPSGPSDSIRDLFAGLLRDGEPLLGVRVRGPWYDLSSPSLYLDSQKSLLAAGFADPGITSLVHPEARVHPSARLRRSVVGPGSVVREGATVVRSVLWRGVVVEQDARVQDSILTDGVRTQPGESLSGFVVLTRGVPGRGRTGGLKRYGEQLRTEVATK
jgi:NDP-sugar pyrophosphorylase family protein